MAARQSGRFLTLLMVASVGLALGGPGDPSLVTASSLPTIDRVVVIIEQNHTFDTYFSGYPGADSATEPVALEDGNGGSVSRLPIGMVTVPTFGAGEEPLANGHAAALEAYAGGDMTGFAAAQAARGRSADLAMSYLTPNSAATIWNIADRSVIFDRYFSSYLGGSLPNTMSLFSGDTFGLTRSSKASLRRLYEEDIETTIDVVADRGRTARLYVGAFKEVDGAAVLRGDYLREDVRTPSAFYWMPPLAMPRFWSARSLKGVITSQEAYFDDAATGNLPDLSYVLPTPTDHPLTEASVAHGRLVQLVNAALKGPEAGGTVVLVVWDDWGGFYDHVPPPLGRGFRVPAMMIGPAVKQGHVSSAVLDHTSAYEFIVNVFPAGGTQSLEPFTDAFVSHADVAHPGVFTVATLPSSPVGTDLENTRLRVAYGLSAAGLGVLLLVFAGYRHRP